MNIALVITAAGNSVRFGADKLSYAVNGKPMLAYALELYASLADCFCTRIIVLQPQRSQQIALAQTLGFSTVFNDAPQLGISHSVVLGTLAALQSDPDGVLYAVGDQPNMQANTVLSLLAAFSRQPDFIVAPCAAGKRGNPVLFPRTLLHELTTLTGDVGGSTVIKRHPQLLKTVPVSSRELIDIDTNSEG